MNKNMFKLLLVCFLDMMSYAIFSPVAAFLFLEGDYSLLPEGFDNRYLLFGFFLSTYSIVQVFSSPLLGKLAVKTSKRFVLLCSFVGNVFGYLLCSYGIYEREIIYLFLGCASAGFTGANMSMINAFISCETKSVHWSRNYSLFGAVIGTSFALGPQISSFFISYFSGFEAFYMLLLFCSFLSIVNCFLVYFWVFESKEPVKKEKENVNFLEKTPSFLSLNKNMLSILLFLFCVYFSWLSFIKFFQVYLVSIFSLSESDCCQMTSFLGFCCCLWQGLRFFFKFKFLDKYPWILFSTFLMFVNFSVYIFVENVFSLIFMTFSISFSYAALAPSVLSLLFKQGDLPKAYKSSLYQSLKALAQIIAPLSSGYVLSRNFISPNILSVVVIFCALILLLLNGESFDSNKEEEITQFNSETGESV